MNKPLLIINNTKILLTFLLLSLMGLKTFSQQKKNMTGETQLDVLLKSMKPELNPGEYVFCTIKNLENLRLTKDIIGCFKEKEGFTVILEKSIADKRKLNYTYIASWITLTVHSSLDAVGLTAAFSGALAKANISCNVVAGYYHDHLFVNKNDAQKALSILQQLAQ